MINVFFPYYQCGDTERQREIDLCLEKNIENKDINKLIVLIDDDSELKVKSDKVQTIHLLERPTYRKWIELTNELALSGISVLCNSDIYFDSSITQFYEVMSDEYSFVALSRWELLGNKTELHPNPHWSQDVWAVRCDDSYSGEMLHLLEFPMGVPRCDNKVAYLFAIYGWKVFNPCSVLKSIHVHETQMRTYQKKIDERIIGAVAHVYPPEDPYNEASIETSIWVKRSEHIKTAKINKTLERWKKESIEEAASNNNVTLQYDLANPSDLKHAMENGECVYNLANQFRVFKSKQGFFFRNIFAPLTFLRIPNSDENQLTSIEVAAGLIPPVITTYVRDIGLKPQDKNDLNFWQYPCATEKQAYENQLDTLSGEHVSEDHVIHTYLPLPWATYIDKKSQPEEYLSGLSSLIGKYKQIAKENNCVLKVHSVCQHIRWINILELAKKLGVTDLHISHKNSKSESIQQELGYSFTLHAWALIAVNYVTPERSEGMERKSIESKSLLASFIGAHMPHYIDDSRLKLFDAAKKSGREDVFVDLGNEWHFNKTVYEEQVLSREIEAHHIDEHHQKTFRYNAVLSDSVFSLCPIGAGPNTLRLWESIAVGSIPVVFDNDLAVFKECDHGVQLLENIVVWESKLDDSLFNFLSSIDKSELEIKSNNLVKIYESFEKKGVKKNLLDKKFELPQERTKFSSNEKDKKTLNILYVGASVTAQKNGYRPALNSLFVDAGFNVNEKVLATGATGSMFGICNLSTLNKVDKYDLAVYEYSTGDLNIGLTPQDKIQSIVSESLRFLTGTASRVVLVNNYRSDYEGTKGDFIRKLYINAAKNVGVDTLDMYEYFEQLREKSSVEEWKTLYRDNVHTADAGSVVLAKKLFSELNNKFDFEQTKDIDSKALTALDAKFVDVTNGLSKHGTYIYPSTSQSFDFISLKEDEKLTFTLKGELWGLVSIVGPQSGWVDVKANGQSIQKFCQFDQHCYYTRVQPRQFIRSFEVDTEIEIHLVSDEIDFSQAKEDKPEFASERLVNISKLMGLKLIITNLQIKKRN